MPLLTPKPSTTTSQASKIAEQQWTPNYDKIISHLKHLKGNVSLHPWVCDKLSVKAFRPSYIIYLAAWVPEGRKGQSQRKGPVAEVDPSYNQNPDESHWLLELSHELKEGNLAIPIPIYLWSTITILNTVTRFLNSSKFSPGILSKRHRNNNQRTFAIHPQSWRSRSRVSTWKTVISSLNSSMVRPWLLSSM